jgi:predicted nucleic acid-binding protein
VNDGDSILEAARIQSRWRLSFWDALIVQAAMKGRCETLLSEDLAHGQSIETLTIQNPF